MAPFSIDARRRFGKRSSTPWQMRAANVSEMPRSWKATSGKAACLKPSKPPAPPSLPVRQSLPYCDTPLRPAWSASGMPASLICAHTGSNLRVTRRDVALAVGHRAGDHHEDPGAGLEHAPDLGGGQVGVGQRDHGCRVQAAVASVEAPVLVEPSVEGGEGGVQRWHVVLERLLHPDAERGEQQRAVHALLVEELQAGVAVAVARVVGDRLELAEHRLEVDPVLVATAEVVLEAAGLGDGIEGRVRDELVDPAADEQAPLAVDLGPLHAPLGHRGVDEAGEGVLGLVVVVVGVEGAEAELGHARIVPVGHPF